MSGDLEKLLSWSHNHRTRPSKSYAPTSRRCNTHTHTHTHTHLLAYDTNSMGSPSPVRSGAQDVAPMHATEIIRFEKRGSMNCTTMPKRSAKPAGLLEGDLWV